MYYFNQLMPFLRHMVKILHIRVKIGEIIFWKD
mgnify:CR=1 FL=1